MINLNSLNLMQKAAVTTKSKKTFIVAGAGCGKTRVLTYRIAYLIDNGIDEKDILAFTFTNKSAFEMKDRLKELLNYESDVSLSTFHSFAYKYVKIFFNVLGFKQDFKIIDEDEKKKIIKRILIDGNYPLEEAFVIKEISNIKSLIDLNIKTLNKRMQVLKVFYIYQETLKTSNLMDFDDLLFYFYDLLQTNENIQNRFTYHTYVLVDECQDINKIQYEIIKLLARKSQNIFMVGDEDQCIYSFRGSDLNCIRNFINEEKADVIKLEQNYRSCQNILMAANSVIKNNSSRVDKRLYTNYNDKNYKLIISDFYTDYEESVYIADLIEELINRNYNYRDFTILYRNNSISIPIEKELVKRKIPFYIFGKNPYFRRKEVKTIIYYLRLILNHNDNVAFLEIINYPKRGIGEYTINLIKDNIINYGLSFYETIKNNPDLYSFDGIKSFVTIIEKFTAIINDCDLVVFVKELLKDLDYFNILRNDKNSKERLLNVYSFLDMISNIEEIGSNVDRLNTFLADIYLENIKHDENKNYVKLMTIHQAKGLEYKIVILSGCNDGILPSTHETIDLIEEERRLFYVAITRAKERLYLLSSKRRLVNGQYKSYAISPFVLEINKTTVNFN